MGRTLLMSAASVGVALVEPRPERPGLRLDRVVAHKIDHVQTQPLREPGLEREGLGEMETRLQEQDGDVGSDLRRHVHHAGAFSLEGRGERDPGQRRLLERPADDLARVHTREARVDFLEIFVGKEGLGHRASRSAAGRREV